MLYYNQDQNLCNLIKRGLSNSFGKPSGLGKGGSEEQRHRRSHLSKNKTNNFLKNQKVGLAVSGGVDSMVLLDVFQKLRKTKKLELYVLHYNHRWRKKSFMDASLVKKYCDKHNINFLYKENKGKVLKDEEKARNERYLFFKSVAQEYKLKIICTAHHKDDQLETVLFRLARGTGPRGLSPIKEFYNLTNEIKVFRPFLNVIKQEIYKYAKRNKIPYLTDKTNFDTSYKRNLIRLKLVPLLKQINKNATDNIIACSNLIYSEHNVLDSYCLKVLQSLSKKNYLYWDKAKFLRLNEYTQNAFIYWFLTKYNMRGNLNKINTIKRTIIQNQKLDLEKNYFLIVDKNQIKFQKKKNERTKEQKVKKDLNIRINPFKIKNFDNNFPKDKKKIAYVDLSKYCNKKLIVRHRKPFDVFHPLGFSSAVKFKKYLINKKVPKAKRNNLPLLCYGNEVLWLPGYSLSEKLKVVDKPTHILEVR